MNFCVTDGETVVAIRYVSSKVDEAASLVGAFRSHRKQRTDAGPLLLVVLVGHIVRRIQGRWPLQDVEGRQTREYHHGVYISLHHPTAKNAAHWAIRLQVSL